ncbi:hypothetical protein JD969_06185 [Planctomycetota bacterium]|nr:hypothetical protein JD969_06185 [Planctomycetota bacterium]
MKYWVWSLCVCLLCVVNVHAVDWDARGRMIEKYEDYLLLKSEDYEQLDFAVKLFEEALLPLFENAVENAKGYGYEHEGELAYFDFKLNAETEASEAKRKQAKENERFKKYFSTTLPMVAYAYLVPGPEEGANPYYKNKEVLALYLKGLEYCYSRGLDEKTWYPDHGTQTSHKAMKAGLVRESGDFSGVSLHMGGFVQSVFLMRGELEEAGLIEKYVKVLRNAAINNGLMYAGFYEYARDDAGFVFNKNPEKYSKGTINADGMRLFVDYFVPYYLMIRDEKELEEMDAVLARVIDTNLAVKVGIQDTIKPDGTGFHHATAYVGGYSPQTLESFAQLLYLVSEMDVFDEENVEVVKYAIETFRVMVQKYQVSGALRGRLIQGGNEGAAMVITKAMALLAHDGGFGDKQMQGRFTEYFDADVFLHGELMEEYFKGNRGIAIKGLGIYRMISDLVGEDIKKADVPEGAFVKPYAAAAFFRKDDWLVVAKGFSQYFWDYEGPIKKRQNSFGQNWAYGMLQVFSAGEPVSEVGSGCDMMDGWDWYHVPGTTASHYPIKERSQKEVMKQKKAAGIMHKDVHRHYSGQTYVGGVSVGNAGMFVMELEGVPFYSTNDLRARKSYFFVGGKVYAMGRDIRGGTDKDETHTTLFQTKLTEENNVTVVDGNKHVSDTYSRMLGKDVGLIDSVGNSFYLVDSTNELVFERRIQQSMTPRFEKTEARYATAYLNHGIKPEGDDYFYVVMPGDKDGDALSELRSNFDAYSNVVEDKRVHVIEFPKDGVTGYGFYELAETSQNMLVKSVNIEACVMTVNEGESVKIGVSVPDIGWESSETDAQLGGLNYGAKKYAKQAAKVHELEVTLRGKWKLAGEYEGVEVRVKENETIVSVKCSDGLSEVFSVREIK